MDWTALQRIEWASVFSFLGLAVTPIVAATAWFGKARRERDTVRVALVAEVTALRDIAQERRYVHDLLETADELKQLDESERPGKTFRVSVPDHYCRVYVAHIAKLGMLEAEDAKLVVRFYQYADSVVTDISKGGALYEGSNEPGAFEENAQILSLAIEVANELERRNAKAHSTRSKWSN